MLLVESMGGHMGIASEPGKGSTFHFSLGFMRAGAEQEDRAKELVGHG
jgi:signal transduction histidine kinase